MAQLPASTPPKYSQTALVQIHLIQDEENNKIAQELKDNQNIAEEFLPEQISTSKFLEKFRMPDMNFPQQAYNV